MVELGLGNKTTSILLDDSVLIDCGTGLGDLSLEEMSKLEHIFITHSHLDHIALAADAFGYRLRFFGRSAFDVALQTRNV